MSSDHCPLNSFITCQLISLPADVTERAELCKIHNSLRLKLIISEYQNHNLILQERR
jgi:hypothetical protein